MRFAILFVGAMATAMALTVKSIYGLWYLSSDLVFVILFPQLVCVVYIKHHCNTHGSLGAYIIGLLLRGLGGEDIIGLPAVIRYPFYNEEDGQLFPFRTLAMLTSLASILSISSLTRWLFESGTIPARFDVFHCVVNIPEDIMKVQEPHEGEMTVLNAGGLVKSYQTEMNGRVNPALNLHPEEDVEGFQVKPSAAAGADPLSPFGGGPLSTTAAQPPPPLGDRGDALSSEDTTKL